jgi:hypothetical protein
MCVALRIVASNKYCVVLFFCRLFFLFFFISCCPSTQFHWIVHFWLILRYSRTFISLEKNDQRIYKFHTKKISQFLCLMLEHICVLYPHPPTRQEKNSSTVSITVQTLFSSINPRLYCISIFKCMYVYYSAS